MSELQFPLKNDTSRKIIHIDMDAFFASVEERDEIKAYCDAHDISVSDFTRELVFQKIRENM